MTERVEFSHIYQRESGPIVRTVYANLPYGPVMVEFHGEDPYVLCYPSDDRRVYIQQMRQAQMDADHCWAISLKQRCSYRMVSPGRYELEDTP